MVKSQKGLISVAGKCADQLQAAHPCHLIPSVTLTGAFADKWNVAPATVRGYLTEAVAEGILLEIILRRDWLVIWPMATGLPPLYAEEENGLYKLVKDRPVSRGSGNLSFLMSPVAFQVFIERLRAELRTSELAR